MVKKSRLEYLNFARAGLTLLVVLYHSSGYLLNGSGSNLFSHIASSALGMVAVAAFFTLSGLAIKYNNSDLDIRSFYKKRFLSIFPSFWFVWGIAYLIKVIKCQSFFYNGRKLSILLSFCGLDGYLGGAYCQAGEWFLGAVILLYMLYPLLLWLFKYAKTVSCWVLAIVYYFVISRDCFGVSGFRNILTCLLSFWIGMLLADIIEKISDNWLLCVVLISTMWHIATANSPFTAYTGCVVWGASLLVVLCIAGRAIQMSAIHGAFSFLSGISFQIFLVHHIILGKMADLMGAWLELWWQKWLYEIVSFVAIIVCAYTLWWVAGIIKKRLSKEAGSRE